MTRVSLSRRQFTGLLGAGLGGAAMAAPMARGVAHARRPTGTGADAVMLNSNENPYGPSKAALLAIGRAEKEFARYPDASEEEVVRAIALHHAVAPEQVVLGCGSGEVLHMAAAAWLGSGRTIVAAEPTFEAVIEYAQVTRAEAVKVPLDAAHRHDLPAMAAACDARTGLVYVCNPNNPTGTVVPGSDLRAFLDRVPAAAVVLVDEAYHHFVEDARYRSAADWLKDVPNLVVVRTFSKIHGMAGMRLGYALASPANARALGEQRFWNNTNAAVLAGALASVRDEAHVLDQRRRLNQTRRQLCQALAAEGRTFIPSETNFVMFDIGRDVKPVIDAFRARGILVGRKFPSLPNWLRVSMGAPHEMKAFLAALRDIVPAAGISSSPAA
jgi:histidinol-phosphate aminotransferase